MRLPLRMSEFFSPDLGNLNGDGHPRVVRLARKLAAAIVARSPAKAVAVELAEPGCFNAVDALAYLEGFNTGGIGRGERRWAVAVSVTVAYEGDPRPGELIFPRKIAMAPSTT